MQFLFCFSRAGVRGAANITALQVLHSPPTAIHKFRYLTYISSFTSPMKKTANFCINRSISSLSVSILLGTWSVRRNQATKNE